MEVGMESNQIDDAKKKRRDAMLLLKEYCETFKLATVVSAEKLKQWERIYGPMLVGAFLPGDAGPPVAWVSPDGVLTMEQDEDLLKGSEPAVAEMSADLVRVAINNRRPIHPVS
jgi:hypothetical protein